MNRLGMIVDISHVSDKTFWDALEVSKAPIFASHSSCRALSPAPRNMTDEMIAALGKKHGVVQINFSCDFLNPEVFAANAANREKQVKLRDELIKKYAERSRMACKRPSAKPAPPTEPALSAPPSPTSSATSTTWSRSPASMPSASAAISTASAARPKASTAWISGPT